MSQPPFNAELHEFLTKTIHEEREIEDLKAYIKKLEGENETLRTSKNRLGNPAVVGLAGFGTTTLVLQFHNLELMGIGPVVWLGIMFGGLAQLIAGLQEFGTGNNFGYCAFSTYGAFWMSLAFLLLGNKYDIYKCSDVDLGFYMLGFTLITFILLIASARQNCAIFFVFVTLIVGFILIDISYFAHLPHVRIAAGVVLIPCALGAW